MPFAMGTGNGAILVKEGNYAVNTLQASVFWLLTFPLLVAIDNLRLSYRKIQENDLGCLEVEPLQFFATVL